MRAAWLGWCSGTICGYHCGMFPHIATSPMVRRAGAGALALRGVPPARPRSTLRLDLRVSGRRTAEERSKVQSAAPVDETRRPCMVASCSRWDAARPRRGRDQSLARPCCPGRHVGACVSSGCEGVLERSAAPWLENGFRRGSRSGTRRHVSNFLLRMGCWHSTRAQHIFGVRACVSGTHRAAPGSGSRHAGMGALRDVLGHPGRLLDALGDVLGRQGRASDGVRTAKGGLGEGPGPSQK